MFQFGVDIALYLSVGLVSLFINLYATPFRRGFFCTDESIRYPFRTDTIPFSIVGAIGTLVPIFTIAVVEWFNLYRIDVVRYGDDILKAGHKFCRGKIHPYIVRVYSFTGTICCLVRLCKFLLSSLL